MRTDARSIFFTALLLFLAVSAWRLWVHLKPPVEEAVVVASTPPKLSGTKPLGVIGFVSNQFAPQALVVPINPFRPTFEMMVRNPETGDLEAVVRGAQTDTGQPGGAQRGPRWGGKGSGKTPGGGQTGGQSGATGGTGGSAGSAQPTQTRYAYRGMLQRPDGKVAAYVIATPGGGRFFTKGDKIEDADIVQTDGAGITLRLKDGSSQQLKAGDQPQPIGGEE